MHIKTKNKPNISEQEDQIQDLRAALKNQKNSLTSCFCNRPEDQVHTSTCNQAMWVMKKWKIK